MADKQRESTVFTSKLGSLDPQKDSSEIKQVREEILAIRDQIEQFQIDLAQKHQDLFVSELLMAMQKPEVPEYPSGDDGEVEDKNLQFFYYKEHFFDNFDLSSSGLLRTPLYQPKVDEYLDKLTFQHPDSIKKAADYLLSLTESNQETFRYVMVRLTTKYETSKVMGMEEVFVYLAENYYLTGKAFWADEDLVEKFQKRINELKPNLIGAIAPDMILLDTMMKKVQLSQLKSRFIVLYFYDPDCGHCKKITPVLYELYKKIKGKGVEVMAACTVTDIEKWKKYIRTNNLNWLNVSDPYYKSNFRAEYDIKTTPLIFILNDEKEIIAKRLGVDQIEDFIDRMIEFEEG
jgi:peroxiredoxin